ncbi:phenylacetate-CoA ligase [Aquimarina sp. MAR_2010_214]|uniref:phenylacetate--CoA ligase family protein n=1 Tax=Aquimarina sp. MAR_2010_214 TaxID=1250026 RepID=UPI000C712BAA|nr:phenylacetate--CoA ligase family protein [Aquimarina sp. MAR_2010_214]PKV50988.1 phenylacetate-CoA ligase [Aquimarina sp. MAR_2010_214]
MKISEIIRNKAFWSIDALTGGKKRHHYNDIKFILENPVSQKAIDFKARNLQNVLEHAIASTQNYQKYKTYNSLEDFPVVNKNIIRDNFENFQSKEYVNLPKFTVSTSGSTGTPFKVYQDKRKRVRSIVDTIFFSEMAGFKIGYKLTYFRLWNAFEKKGKFTQWVQNLIPVDVFELSKESEIQNILNTLSQSKSSNSWLGYASAYEEICKYLDKNPSLKVAYTLKSAIAISERLSDYTKQAMKKYFNINIISRYSNVENGIIAQQLLEEDFFRVNEASYFVEVLKLDSDEPIEDGKPGRIVITDLFNYCMPMIRYDTGDIGVKNTIKSKIVLSIIEGRKIDVIYNTKGDIITINLVLLVNKYPMLKQCQLIQKSVGKYHLKLNIEKEFIREEEFLSEFKVYLGEDANISVEYVDEIPLLASGKRRVMVNEMINS